MKQSAANSDSKATMRANACRSSGAAPSAGSRFCAASPIWWVWPFGGPCWSTIAPHAAQEPRPGELRDVVVQIHAGQHAG